MEIDPTPPGNADDSGRRVGAVVAQGEIPFAILHDQRIIVARFRTAVESKGIGWDDDEVTRWTLAFNGHPFEVIARDGWLPIDDYWAYGDRTPLTALADGERHIVHYHYYYAHHLGSVSGDVTLTCDLKAMTVAVDTDLEVDLD